MRHVVEEEVRAAVAPRAAIAAVATALAEAGEAPAATAEAGLAGLPGLAAQLASGAGSGGVLARASTRSADGAALCVFGRDGRLRATVEADWLTRLTAAAATLVAARSLGPAEPAVCAVLGAGELARAVLACVRAELPSAELRVAAPDTAAAAALARDAGARAAASLQAAAAGADVVVLATRARDPVARDEWLSSALFVAALGATTPGQRELDYRTLVRAAFVAVDDPDGALARASDLGETIAAGHLDWLEVHALADVAAGLEGRQAADDLVVYKAVGSAALVLAVAEQALLA
jgi:ornithine cyclodeaminase/alanine dehydrogenase-like protein (mu-crystallin family)